MLTKILLDILFVTALTRKHEYLNIEPLRLQCNSIVLYLSSQLLCLLNWSKKLKYENFDCNNLNILGVKEIRTCCSEPRQVVSVS